MQIALGETICLEGDDGGAGIEHDTNMDVCHQDHGRVHPETGCPVSLQRIAWMDLE
jgi:hypothetical protein